jgi:uncharacterized protein YbaP (TraB family)
MCKKDILISHSLKQALEASDEVYFEMDLDDPVNTFGGLLYMNMKDGKKLKDFFTEEEYQRLETYFSDSLKMPLSLFDKMKPMMLQSMLYPKLLGCKESSGVEMELMQLAVQQKKEIKGFETIEEQSSFFDSIPYEVQAKELLKSIDSLHYMTAEFDSMLLVYKEQRLSDMEKMFSESELTTGENKDVLLDKRNHNWVSQLEKLLSQKGLFIAVGAGHLPGESGLIHLLRKAGYTLTPLLNH